MRTRIFVFLDAVCTCLKKYPWSIFVIIKCHCNNYEIIDNDIDVD